MKSNPRVGCCWGVWDRCTKTSAAEQLGLLEDENKIERQSEVLASFKVSGDLGDTTEKLFETIGKKHDIRSITSVYQDLLTIAKEFGSGSQDRKIRGVILVLQECTAQTAKYIVRIVLSTLRLGFSDMTILDSLSL